MPAPPALDPTPPGDAALREAVRAWADGLSRERRMARNTVEAYERDLRQFLLHLDARRGTPRIPDLVALKPRDVRAFMAARRAEGIGGRSLMRALAGVRSFARYLEREGHGTVAALGAVRSPKVERRLPRPLGVAAARAMTRTDLREGEDREPWILARDAAVLALLYGAGLRISEALGIARKDAPLTGIDAVTVTGKGGKVRMVPVLPVVAEAVAAYLKACPYTLDPDDALFVGARGGPLSPASSSTPWPPCGAPSACRTAPRRMPCATPSRRISSPAGESCGRSRSCSVTPRSRRRSSTRSSTPHD
ncbi:recombinase XerC [Methylobacterium durans]|uniref:Recombinase XerC n=1 Tax=Methylobacterium durans TaxID=2202825 RepID=A0A2U8W501_9HYPH|nr:recombinase XerC [Methylobacterium durans]